MLQKTKKEQQGPVLLWDISPPHLDAKQLAKVCKCSARILDPSPLLHMEDYLVGPSSPNDGQISGSSQAVQPLRRAASLAPGNVCSSFFPHVRVCVCVCVSLKWPLLGRLLDWNISPQESHRLPQLLRLRPQLGALARRSIIS